MTATKPVATQAGLLERHSGRSQGLDLDPANAMKGSDSEMIQPPEKRSYNTVFFLVARGMAPKSFIRKMNRFCKRTVLLGCI